MWHKQINHIDVLPYDDGDDDDNGDDCYCLPKHVDIVAYVVGKMLSELACIKL